MGVKKVTLRGLKLGGVTPKEKKILEMLVSEYLTPKKIAIRLEISIQTVYKHIRALKRKGVLKKNLNRGYFSDSTFNPFKKIRLHGLHFHLKILHKKKSYETLIKKKANTIFIDDSTIRLHKDSIQIYINQSFYGSDTNEATRKGIEFFNKLLIKLENDFDLVLTKPRSQNIRLVKSHYAEINNELAKEAEIKGEKIQLRTTDDGKVWFLIDKSLNMNEAETVHPETSEKDMRETIAPFFEYLRKNPMAIQDLFSLQISSINKIDNVLLPLIKSGVEMQNQTTKQLQVLIKSINNVFGVKKPKRKSNKTNNLVGKPYYVG